MLLTFACDISICFGTGILDIFYLLKNVEKLVWHKSISTLYRSEFVKRRKQGK